MSDITFHGAVTAHNIVPSQHAAGGGTINNYFNGSNQNVQRSLRAPSAVIPFERDENFIERADAMRWIRSKCLWPGSRVALVGLGGVGKSQLAIQYAYEVRRDAPETWVFWVHTTSFEHFEQGYRRIAETLDLPWQNIPRMQVLQLVSGWLDDERNGKWVMILDGIDIHGLFGSLSDDDGIMHFLPQSTRGTILITSRNRNIAKQIVGMVRNIYEVGVMSELNALQLLHTKLENPPMEEEARELARALGYIPLAIVQASSHINKARPRLSIALYLENFNKSDDLKASLLSEDVDDLRRDPSASNAVMTIWQITFERISQDEQHTSNLLSIISFCGTQIIPGYLFHGFNGQDPDTTEYEFERDIGVLEAHCLVSKTNDDHFEVQPLVKFCARWWLRKTGMFKYWKSHFLILLSRNYPIPDRESEAQCEKLEPHVQSVIHEQPANDDSQHWAVLASKIGRYRRMRGDYKDGERLLRSAKAIFEKLQVHDESQELQRLECLNALGHVLFAREKVSEAEAIICGVLERRVALLGEEHHDNLSSRGLFAHILTVKGSYEASQQMYHGILRKMEKLFGRNSSEAAEVIVNYANSLYMERKHMEAEAMYREALAISEGVNGTRSAVTAAYLQRLAMCLGEQGKFAEAERLFSQAFASSKGDSGNRRLGPDLCSDYALLLTKQGSHMEAESIFRECLRMNEELFGGDDSATALARYNLACCLMHQWRYEEAELALREVMRLHGREYPKEAGGLRDLVLCLEAQWKNKEAAEVLREVLSIQEAVFGEKHSETADVLAYLGFNLLVQHKHKEAEQMHESSLRMKENLLGKRNHSMLHTVGNLAHAYARSAAKAFARHVIMRNSDATDALLGIRLIRLGPSGGHMGF